MRTLLCPACLAFITAEKRNALAVMRAHATSVDHPLTGCLDVDATFARIVGLSFGAAARR